MAHVEKKGRGKAAAVAMALSLKVHLLLPWQQLVLIKAAAAAT